MPSLRSVIAGTIALAITAVIPPATATAVSSSPPYNAFMLDGGTGSWLLTGVRAFDDTNSTIGASRFGEGFSARVSTAGFEFWWDVSFQPPVGSTITVGTTYPTLGLRDETHGSMNVGGDGRGCNYQSGFMTVKEFVLDPETNTVTSLAASFSVSCESDVQVFWGDVRFNSSLAVAATVPSPTSVNFGTQLVGQQGPEHTVTYTAAGSSDSVLGAASIVNGNSFAITGDTCSNTTLVVGSTCTIRVRARATAAGLQTASLDLPVNSGSGVVHVPLSVTGERVNAGSYYPLPPSRVLDTREGNGAPRAPVGPGGIIHLQVEGRGGLPANGVSAVVLNVTVTGPTTSGHVTVWPSGVAKPTASSLNFVPGWTGANSVTVAVGTGGKVDLFNSAGNTHLIADVVGYYAKDNSLVPSRGIGGEFQPVLPERLFDSRVDWGEQLPAGFWLELPVSYGQEVYDPHIRALAVNITAVNGRGHGFLTAFSAEGVPPPTSTLNFSPGAIVSNFAIVPTGRCFDCGPGVYPMIGVYTSVDVDVIVDIIGFYDDGQLADGTHDGLRFTPRTPLRIADSRIGLGLPGALAPGATGSLEPPASSLPPATEALALNVTAVTPTANTFVSIWPTGLPQPPISTLNPGAGQIVPNATAVLLGNGNRFNAYNNAGSTHLVIDMVGTFYFLPALSAFGPSVAFKHPDGKANGLKTTKLPAQLHRP